MLAAGEGAFRAWVGAWAVVATLALQVLANFANEVGDMQKGTDNARRLGPRRSLQEGTLTTRDLTRGMAVAAVVAVVAGLLLVREAFGGWMEWRAVALIATGAAAIAAAVKYTVGRRAYGYRGLGDLFVMVFFGWVSVTGCCFAMTGRVVLSSLLPATAIGAFSVMVLNVNNTRDLENDRACGKRTLPVVLGERRARVYHLCLLALGMLCLLATPFARGTGFPGFLFLLATPLLWLHVRAITRLSGRALDPQLRLLSLTTLLIAFLTGLPELFHLP
jgi:1,4-dihydroxy-2-naphthoate octaprenyltransferase